MSETAEQPVSVAERIVNAINNWPLSLVNEPEQLKADAAIIKADFEERGGLTAWAEASHAAEVAFVEMVLREEAERGSHAETTL